MATDRLLIGALAITLVGCNGLIGDPPGADGTAGGGGPGGPGDAALECGAEEPRLPSPLSLRRLSAREIDHTLRDLLGDTTAPGARLGADEVVAGFASNSVAPLGEEVVEAWMDVTEEIAARAVAAHASEWMSCDRASVACVRPWLESFGLRAFRRPLTTEELDDFVATWDAARVEHGTDVAIEMIVQILLASPEMLYHVEIGQPGRDGGLVLGAYERASALSYFLWSTMPDDALFEAAATGALDTEDGIRAEVERMIADPRVSQAIESFAWQWLSLAPAEELTKDTELFPFWNDEVAAELAEEPVRFFDAVLRTGDARLETLLTGSFTVGSETLSSFYGVAAPSTDGRIELPAGERSGFLTLAGFLASHSYAADTSWVHRGRFVRAQLLCNPPPSPPADINTTAGNDLGRLENPECAGCHQLMDPIGWGFDSYDPTGRFSAAPSEGRIANGAAFDMPETFDGAIELSQALASSDAVADCFALQWTRFALGRKETRDDACAIDDVQGAFRESGGDVRALLVAIATSPAFLERMDPPTE